MIICEHFPFDIGARFYFIVCVKRESKWCWIDKQVWLCIIRFEMVTLFCVADYICAIATVFFLTFLAIFTTGFLFSLFTPNSSVTFYLKFVYGGKLYRMHTAYVTTFGLFWRNNLRLQTSYCSWNVSILWSVNMSTSNFGSTSVFISFLFSLFAVRFN